MYLYFVLLFLVQQDFCLNCPNTYINSDNLCIHMSNRLLELSDMTSYCQNEASGGVPLDRRFTDKRMEKVGRILKYMVENNLPNEVFIGMKREADAFGKPTKNFKYENNEGTVNERDYPLWDGDPEYFDCGVVEYQNDFKVKPKACSQSAPSLCEKNEPPCQDVGGVRYVSHRGRCLGIFPRQDFDYTSGSMACGNSGGHVATFKSRAEAQSIAEGILNSYLSLDGGIYAALKKSDSGSWMYENGEEETSRWDPEYDREFDCGVYRFVSNLTLGIFTMPCDRPIRALCMWKGDEE